MLLGSLFYVFDHRFFLSRDSCVGSFQAFRFLLHFIPKLKVCGRKVVQWRKLILELSSDIIAAFAVNSNSAATPLLALQLLGITSAVRNFQSFLPFQSSSTSHPLIFSCRKNGRILVLLENCNISTCLQVQVQRTLALSWVGMSCYSQVTNA